MVIEAIVTLLLTAPQTPSLPEQLVLSIVVTDKKGKPVTDLAPTEVSLTEGSATVPVARLERDSRPLKVAVVVDTSASMSATLQSDAVPAVLSFLKRLPPSTAFSIWTTTDRPKLLVEQTTDVKAAEGKLRSTPALGNNAAVETLVAASQELARAEGARSAIALVTSSSMGEVTVDVQALLPKASLKPTYMAVELVGGGGMGDARLQDAIKVLVLRTGGFHERVYSAMAIETQLRRAIDLLDAQYRVAWKPAADPRQTKIVVKVSRKDAKVVQAQRLSTAW
jgi:von Willebrand factor type A domain